MTKAVSSERLEEITSELGPKFTPIDRFPRPAAISAKIGGDDAVALWNQIDLQNMSASCVGDDWVEQHIFFDEAETLLRPLLEPSEYSSWTTELAGRAVAPAVDIETAVSKMASSERWRKIENSLLEAINDCLNVAPRPPRPVPSSRVLIVDAPNEELPVWMDLGNWNQCPIAEIHRSFHGHWRCRHGARLLYVSATTVEHEVRKQVNTLDELAQLAFEQLVYCPDIIQLFQRIFEYDEDPITMGLSSPLDYLDMSSFVAQMKSSRWVFWWD